MKSMLLFRNIAVFMLLNNDNDSHIFVIMNNHHSCYKQLDTTAYFLV